jgi:outer membrane biogenesis lipoprotein LolB
MTRIAKLTFAGLALAFLAGCASDPRRSQGLDWVVAQEEERRRLQAQGFPQYALD